MENGFIVLHRKFLKWEWFDDPFMVHLFVYLLLKSNHDKGRWRGIEVKRGQLITGINSLKKDTRISAQTLRTCLTKLKSTGEITIQSTNRFSLVTVVNYDLYQSKEKNQQANQQANQQTANKQLTTNNNNNNNKQRDISVSFEKSNIGTKELFKLAFPKWANDKLLYYFTKASAYSGEGKTYKNWKSNIEAWALADEAQGSITFRDPFKLSNL